MNDDRPLRKPVDYDELFPGRFLKAGLFKGKSVTFTIKAVDVDKLPQDNGRDRVRGVISFNETEMQLCLNSTNGQCFKAMFGRHVADWVGKHVTLCPEQDKFGKETVEAIRVAGSPDIGENITVNISLPRRKPRERTLTVTRKNGQQAAPKPAAPPEDPEDFPR